MSAPEGWQERPFEAQGVTRRVFHRGEGPPVLVMHEMPGITPAVLQFCDRVVERGFRVALPVLFGEPGRGYDAGHVAKSYLHVCVSREFAMLAKHEASPITEWLRALCRSLHEETGKPVGAVGMCLTGNFALALAVDPWLAAPVLSQPSLPIGITASHRAAPHASPAQLACIRARHREDGVTVLGLRFSGDLLVPSERFATLRRELGEAFEAVEIDSTRGNPHGVSRTAHSVLAFDFVDEDGHPTRDALERVLSFLDERLR